MLIPTPISGETSLYFHLPFCKKKCDYCHFYVIPDKDIFKNLLLEALLKEIEMKKSFISSSSIYSIYFGGGTPALAGPPFIEKILKALSPLTSLDSIEITLEVNPENNNLDLLKAYRSIGINRLSIGAQTFDDQLLKGLNRSHLSQDIFLAIENAKKAGFENISIDLMYELPGQTMLHWEKTLQVIPNLPITHISLYNLSIEANTVFYKHRKEIQKKMPKPKNALEMFNAAQKFFKLEGFEHYEISAFSKKNAYSKHNVGYWLQRPHLGFGPSAFSFFKGKRFQNIPNIHRYSASINKSESPVTFEEELIGEEFLKESLALHLRLIEGFDPNLFQKRFGLFSSSLNQTLQKLIDLVLILKTDSLLKLSSKGILFHDSIASEII